MAMAIGTTYDTSHSGFAPFIAFDLFRENKRVLTDEFVARVTSHDLPLRHCLHDGAEALSLDLIVERLGTYGHHGALEPVEGAIWRVEREGRVDFLAKYVHPHKIDGKYLPSEETGAQAIYYWEPG